MIKANAPAAPKGPDIPAQGNALGCEHQRNQPCKGVTRSATVDPVISGRTVTGGRTPCQR